MTVAKSLVYALSEDYAQATGGYVYNQRLVAELAALGWHITRLALPAGFPSPSDTARIRTATLLTALPAGALVLTDQLCIDTIPDVAAAVARHVTLVTIVHHPLAAEGYGPPDVASDFFQAEKQSLRHAALVIATSGTTAKTLRNDYAVEPARIVVAPPGTDPQPLSHGSGRSDQVALLGVGAVVPRKGHDLLIKALATMPDAPWHLSLAGNLDRAPNHVEHISRLASRAGITSRIDFLGEIPAADLEKLWESTDAFVSASRHEGYGMAVAEALARGLPVVTTAAGAIAGWLPPQAAELVPTDDPDLLAAALRRVISDSAHRSQLRTSAAIFRQSLPRWTNTALIADRRLSTLL